MALNDFLTPSKLSWDEKTLTKEYGKVFLEPLERGYGVTIGNSLRRVLLSSIQGDAVTTVKIDGVLHETSVIQGVAEDVLDIIMNMKALVVKTVTGEPQTIYLDVEREGIVTAKDFQANSAVEIFNPDLPIATLSAGAHLQMEVNIGRGRGYVPAEANKKPHHPIGVIPVDSIYSPVQRVKYEVVNTRVGQITDYEKLTLEIWTNGSVTPQDAISTASQIIINHFNVFLKVEDKEEEKVGKGADEKTDSSTPAFDKDLDRSVEELELSVRAYNCLKAANIKTIRELVSYNEESLLKHRNFGKKSLTEIVEILEKLGYSLAPIPQDISDDEDMEFKDTGKKKSRDK